MESRRELARQRLRSADPDLFSKRFTETYREFFARLVTVKDLIDPALVGSSFLAGLRNKRRDLRSILGTYGSFGGFTVELGLQALAWDRDPHDADSVVEFDLEELESLRSALNAGRYQSPAYALTDFLAFLTQAPPAHSEEDEALMDRVLTNLRSLGEGAKKSDLYKAMKEIPGNKYDRATIAEILGSCGILDPDPEDGRKTLPNDLSGPVTYWCGSDGVNEEAVAQWFPRLVLQAQARPEPAGASGEKVGLARLSLEDWTRLRKIADDHPVTLGDSYEEWSARRSKRRARFEAQGHEIIEYHLNVDDLVAWCNRRGCGVTAQARGKFGRELIRTV